MALLVFAILNVMCCYFCYFVGTQKGYNGPLCAFGRVIWQFSCVSDPASDAR